MINARSPLLLVGWASFLRSVAGICTDGATPATGSSCSLLQTPESSISRGVARGYLLQAKGHFEADASTADVCSPECSEEFVSKCMRLWGGGCDGYGSCRDELDAGRGPLSTVCDPGCKDTADMEAFCGGANSGDSSGSTTEAPAARDECQMECSQEFVSRCVPMRGGGCDGYGICRDEVDAGSGPLSTVCVPGCKDTADMEAFCGGPNDGDSSGSTTQPPAARDQCQTECSQEFVSRCVPMYGGGCDGYGMCRVALDAGSLAPLMSRGCVSFCEDTPEMAELCSGGSGGDDGEGGGDGSSNGGGGSSGGIAEPDVPTLCSAANKGRCDCSDDAEFTTYTWWMTPRGSSQREQRCFTLFLPPSLATPAPVLMHMNCYAQDKLMGMSNRDLEGAAERYQFAVMLLSTPEGAWRFGNDGIVNDANPTPCAEDDSADIVYLKTVFGWLQNNSQALRLDMTRVFTEGFSQNSMFAIYTGMCFHEHVVGTWQGGSGLALTGQEPFPPGKQAQCTASSFEEHGHACVNTDPCTECQYWPIYPVATATPYIDCIMSYTDDFMHGSDRPMYDAMSENNHDARLFAFTPGASGGGHTEIANHFSWAVGCLGFWPTCSEACEAKFFDCIASSGSSGDSAFNGCIDTAFASADCATTPCSPTLSMLGKSETPETIKLSEGVFGRRF